MYGVSCDALVGAGAPIADPIRDLEEAPLGCEMILGIITGQIRRRNLHKQQWWRRMMQERTFPPMTEKHLGLAYPIDVSQFIESEMLQNPGVFPYHTMKYLAFYNVLFVNALDFICDKEYSTRSILRFIVWCRNVFGCNKKFKLVLDKYKEEYTPRAHAFPWGSAAALVERINEYLKDFQDEYVSGSATKPAL